MKRKVCLILAFVVLALFNCISCKNVNNKEDLEDNMYFGKDLTITIPESEIIDAEYLQNILDGETKNSLQNFNLWNTQEFIELIGYMKKNNLVIATGTYTFNQAWEFEDGFFLLNNNEKREVLKFEQKNN